MSFFQNIISSIMRNPLRKGLFGGEEFGVLHKDINKALDAVMSTSGEVSSLVYAEHLLNLIEALNDQDLITFLQTLSAKYDIDPGALSKATVNYSKEKNQANLEKVTKSSEPLWVELFRRLNTTQDGTVKLIRLRERIRGLLKDNPEIAFFNSSLLSLFKGWFNPSFLVLEKIDWSTPANILEKIIEYEAVHEINSWDDLRARLAPDDRRCFAFFHPALADEPLIFVEVALTKEIPNSINSILQDRDVKDNEVAEYKTATFYSISNCQPGLKNISFGNFLIKQVVQELQVEFPSIKKFVTLSPIPGFHEWLNDPNNSKGAELADLTEEIKRLPLSADVIESNGEVIKRGAFNYLLSAKKGKYPLDPVARFHLGNGASIHQLNEGADLSEKGISQSRGTMVNYLYDLNHIEQNHEAYATEGGIEYSDKLKPLLVRAS